MTAITSAGGMIALLGDKEMEMRVFALKKLNKIVDVYWSEISSVLELIEVMYEDVNFSHRTLAALVASKVYYHLEDYDSALNYALEAGELFDVSISNEYIDTIITKAIDKYIQLRKDVVNKEKVVIPEKLTKLVYTMFARCMSDKQYKQAIGIALETQHIEVLNEAIVKSEDISGMLNYTYKVAMSLIENRSFRTEVLKEVVKLYKSHDNIMDYSVITNCLVFLNDAAQLADVLFKLCKGTEDDLLLCYQLCFDLYEHANQQFIQEVSAGLCSNLKPIISDADDLIEHQSEIKREPESMSSATATSSNPGERVDTPASITSQSDVEMHIKENSAEDGSEMETESTTPVKEEPVEVKPKSSAERNTEIYKQIKTILNGTQTVQLYLQFLIRNNKTDKNILKQTREQVHNQVTRGATVIANGFSNCGTTNDQFLRDNLDWLGKATNWAKFTCTATLGLIHRLHEKDALSIMSTYLPKQDGTSGSVYTDGGGLYALGLIYANHGADILRYLTTQLVNATDPVVKHGACLGVGLAGLGTANREPYNQLVSEMNADDAVVGEAAGIAIGLVMLGSNDEEAITAMFDYAMETQHEKITRGLSLGLALTVFNRLEQADGLIERMLAAEDPVIRWGGCYAIASAYCGTGKNTQLERLLQIAVSDTSGDVRRIAVASVGFVLCHYPEQCIATVALLAESYNPYVRCGASLALGVSCAGTGSRDALTMLEHLCEDSVPFVRQAAFIASAMILIQHNDITCPVKMKHFRQLFTKTIGDKHEDTVAKMGAVLGQGIIDAGGRNVTISLASRFGGLQTNTVAAAGMMVFCQFWYWYPLTHFLALSFTPTCIIGLNHGLRMPANVEFQSNCRSNVFAYVPPVEVKSNKRPEKVDTAVLSITNRHKHRGNADHPSRRRQLGGIVPAAKKEEKDDKMELDESKSDKKASTITDDAVKTKDEKNEDKDKTKEDAKDGTDVVQPTQVYSNPCRVMPGQLKFMAFPQSQTRYKPLRDLRQGGIVLLKDKRPQEMEDVIDMMEALGQEAEMKPPKPFKFVDPPLPAAKPKLVASSSDKDKDKDGSKEKVDDKKDEKKDGASTSET